MECKLSCDSRHGLRCDCGAAYKGQPTRVVNRKFELYDVYIGRPSKWGNPFGPPATDRLESRLECIAAYREWITHNIDLLNDLPELQGKRLGCYCKPKPCHGDVLVELVEKWVCDCGAFKDEYPFCTSCMEDPLEV